MEHLRQLIKFIKKNPTVWYSVVLIISVTATIYFSTYYLFQRFQLITDQLLRSKAVLAEDVINVFSRDILDQEETIQNRIKTVKENDSEVKDISFLKPTGPEAEKFKIVASTREEERGTDSLSNLDSIAWREEVGFAVLGNDGNGNRFWNVEKMIRDKGGRKIGIVSFKMSLEEHDAFIRQEINRVYVVSLIALLIILLIIANHMRLFKYAIKASKLEEIDQMKDDFISMASHELKSPLVSLRGYIELIKDNVKAEEEKAGKKEEQLHFLGNMDSSVTRLQDLVNDILDVSRLEQNRLPIKNQSFDLKGLVEKTVDEMKISARDKNLGLILDPLPPASASADPERVKQVLVNLISNGIKYTPEGKIEISIKEEDKFLAVVVSDTGLGISAENLKNLFSKFKRVRNKETEKISGTGLGLWISRQLAEKMGGSLDAESIEGVGSHFILKIKKAEVNEK